MAGASLMIGCTSADVEDPGADAPPTAEAAAEEALLEPSPTPESSSTPEPSSTPSSESGPDATTSILTWLEASRAPDVEAACAALAPELVDRMIDEMRSDGFPEVSTCEGMVTVTAELYRAFDQTAEVTVDVQSETESDAVLFVTYVESGDCGTVVMERSAAAWIITEQTEACV